MVAQLIELRVGEQTHRGREEDEGSALDLEPDDEGIVRFRIEGEDEGRPARGTGVGGG